MPHNQIRGRSQVKEWSKIIKKDPTAFGEDAPQEIDSFTLRYTSDVSITHDKDLVTKEYVDSRPSGSGGGIAGGTTSRIVESLTISNGQYNFMLSRTPSAPTVVDLYLNGELQLDGISNDYIITNNQITTTSPLQNTDILLVKYWVINDRVIEKINAVEGQTEITLIRQPLSPSLTDVYKNGISLHEGEDNDYILVEDKLTFIEELEDVDIIIVKYW